MKYGILGEDRSDANTLRIFVRRLNDRALANAKVDKKGKKGKKNLAIKPKNYHGWAELCRKGARDLRQLAKSGCHRFVVCVDADGPDPTARRAHVQKEVITKSNIGRPSCLIIPVQELEAWILADVEHAGPMVILNWKPKAVTSPESIASPKEYLRRLSRDPVKKKARYDEVLHNERMAEYVRLDRIESKCPSFQALADFVLA